MTKSTKNLWKKDSFQAIISAVLIVALIFGFVYGSQLALNTNIPPVLAITSRDMCIPQGGEPRDGWSHPFDRTMQMGDIVVISGVPAKDLRSIYPESDIIVFHNPENPDELIIHRITATTRIDGKTYFFTKGDGSNAQSAWPAVPEPFEYDPWNSRNSSIPQGAVSEDLVVGKVVLRIPWVGNAAIFIHETFGVANSYLIVAVTAVTVVLFLVVEFGVPLLKRIQRTVQQQSNAKRLEMRL